MSNFTFGRTGTLAQPLMPRHALSWVATAFAAGILLNVDRTPPWVPLAAAVFTAWRLLASSHRVALPGTLLRSFLALLLVGAVLLRFHTLNGLGAGSALLILMGSVKLLETRSRRDHYIGIGAALFLLLAACLDRQGLLRSPLYLVDAWLCCASLAVVAYATGQPAAAPAGSSALSPLELEAASASSRASPSTFTGRAAVILASRTLLLALPLAVFLFLFFPRLPGAFWAVPRSDEALTGLSDTMSPGSITRLTASYEVAFRASFEGAPPPVYERYWRGPVLHEFDGTTWRRAPVSAFRSAPLEYLGREYRYQISLEPSSQRWWFSLDTPMGAPTPTPTGPGLAGNAVYFTPDYQLVSANPVLEPTTYTAVSHTTTRAREELSKAARHIDTGLPTDRNPRARQLALRLRAQAPTDQHFLTSLLTYFQAQGFEYSLTPPSLGTDSVDDFLFESRKGFCGHYASAFVSLVRAAGIPARVVTGYLGGEWNPIGNYFIVRQSDAHAWAEVWLEGRGWTRVDPTAVVAPERLRRGILDFLPNAVSAPARFVWAHPWLTGVLQRWDAMNAWWNRRVTQFNYADQLRLLERLGFDSPGARELGWAFAGGLIAWLIWIALHIGRSAKRAPPDKLARAYARLCGKLDRVGLARQPHQGPLAYADQLALERPALALAVRPILMRYAQLRFGSPPQDSYAAEVSRFERAVARLRPAPSRGTRRR